MKDVTVEKAESLVDQIQEVWRGWEGGTLQKEVLRADGTLAFPLVPSWPLSCELEAFLDSQMG